MDGSDARTREHRKRRFRNHRHVHEHSIALSHAHRLQDGRHALHFGMEFGKREDPLLVDFGRHPDQRVLGCAVGQVTVDRVVAKVGTPAHEPSGERRPAVVAYLLERRLPVDQCGLLAPEGIAFFDRTTVEFAIGTHASGLQGRVRDYWPAIARRGSDNTLTRFPPTL